MKFIYTVLFIFSCLAATAQEDMYRIYLKDKKNNEFTLENPQEYLSERALQRRKKYNITIVASDLPVSKAYCDSLKSLGVSIKCSSKWLNCLTVKSNDEQIDTLEKLSFVRKIILTKSISSNNKSGTTESYIRDDMFNQAQTRKSVEEIAVRQIEMAQGNYLHQHNYRGRGMLIAVIDGGFREVNKMGALGHIYDDNGVKDTYDFVHSTPDVYEHSAHGTKVLSLIGGQLDDTFTGTATEADFLLYISEDVNSESWVEEDYWTAAAERADSMGADIINTSLGYSVFDDEEQNYSSIDFDGNTIHITKASDIAASKGMLLVNSAGNEGNKTWKYIAAPADADSVLTVGAVDYNRQSSAFSSHGWPDGGIKPDVTYMGQSVVVIDDDGAMMVGSGTSYSSPLLAGFAACLWQAFPEQNNIEIIKAIRQSAHIYHSPDRDYGYGIPNFAKAFFLINEKDEVDAATTIIYPNPFTESFGCEITGILQNENTLQLYNPQGKLIYTTKYPSFTETESYIELTTLAHLPDGIYLLKINTADKIICRKVVKCSDD